MPLYVVPTTDFSYYSYQLGNGHHRHEGRYYGVRFSVETATARSQKEIYQYLESRSIESLVNAEGYIIDID